jgi:hypothetical protein
VIGGTHCPGFEGQDVPETIGGIAVANGGVGAILGKDDQAGGEYGIVTIVAQLANGDKDVAGNSGEDVGLAGTKG